MKLKEYLKKENMTQVKFASLIGVSKFQVNRLVHGTKTPSFKSLKRIIKATGGLVNTDDFLTKDEVDETQRT